MAASARPYDRREAAIPLSRTATAGVRNAGSALMLRKDQAGDRLYAARGYRPGERVLELAEVAWRPERDGETVEHPFGGHLFHPILAKAGHSCEPNCQIDFEGRALLATTSIAPGDPVTIDYKRTDRRLRQPFDCNCGSSRCRGRIE